MRARFRSEAVADVSTAHGWYEEQRPGLGAEFRGILEEAVERVLEHPMAFPEIMPLVRRALLPRFPYAVYFRVLENEVEVIACLHMRRDPEIWRQRGVGP